MTTYTFQDADIQQGDAIAALEARISALEGGAA